MIDTFVSLLARPRLFLNDDDRTSSTNVCRRLLEELQAIASDDFGCPRPGTVDIGDKRDTDLVHDVMMYLTRLANRTNRPTQNSEVMAKLQARMRQAINAAAPHERAAMKAPSPPVDDDAALRQLLVPAARALHRLAGLSSTIPDDLTALQPVGELASRINAAVDVLVGRESWYDNLAAAANAVVDVIRAAGITAGDASTLSCADVTWLVSGLRRAEALLKDRHPGNDAALTDAVSSVMKALNLEVRRPANAEPTSALKALVDSLRDAAKALMVARDLDRGVLSSTNALSRLASPATERERFDALPASAPVHVVQNRLEHVANRLAAVLATHERRSSELRSIMRHHGWLPAAATTHEEVHEQLVGRLTRLGEASRAL